LSDIEHRKQVPLLHGHGSTARCVKALSDGRAISSSRDTTLRIWNIETGDCEGVLEGHTQTVRTFAIHGNIMASGSYDSEGRVWSLQTKECFHALKGHESQIYSVAFDGRGLSQEVWTRSLGCEIRRLSLFCILPRLAVN
jgi:F-box and WD-40 domain protein CDC4